MKAVILAGGLGTRLSEETALRPKPMVEIGNRPILWHIMKLYTHFGINDFVICVGYKGYKIKEYFANYAIHTSDVTFDFNDNSVNFHESYGEPWKVTIIDTGEDTLTGSRIKLAQRYIGNEPFCLTYGDGLANVDIRATIDFHKSHNQACTVTAVQPLGRFGTLALANTTVSEFTEKPAGDGQWINGGFFVCDASIFEYIPDNANVSWEAEPLKQLTAAGQLAAYQHHGFWQPMDTLRDRKKLDTLWDSGQAPWCLWPTNQPAS